MVRKNGKIVQLSVAALLLLAPVAAHAEKQEDKAMPKLAAGFSYVTCYFGNVNDHQWKWALMPDNSFFSVAGEWTKSPITKIDRFETKTPQASIETACAQAKAFYKVTGNFFAAFAAKTALGRRFPFLSNETYLYPRY